MSFCPSKDIHSVYLDNELPEVYKAEYEAHIAVCQKCAKELEILKSLRSELKADAKSITPDEHFMDESFNRLMTKMSYSKNVKRAYSSESAKAKHYLYPLSAVAAAAVFALILPFGLNSNKSVAAENQTNAYTPLVSSISGTQTINPTGGIKAIGSTKANNVAYDTGKIMTVSGNIQRASFSSNNQTQSENREITTAVKYASILRPDIFEEDDAISIRITIPGMNNSPIVTEMTLPMDVISGNY